MFSKTTSLAIACLAIHTIFLVLLSSVAYGGWNSSGWKGDFQQHDEDFAMASKLPYIEKSPDGKLTPSIKANKILFELRTRLYDMNGASLYLQANYDKAAVVVKNLKEKRNTIQINPVKVERLRQDLEKIGAEAAKLHKDIDKNVGTFRNFRLRLHQAFPRHVAVLDAYFNEILQLRKRAERCSLQVARKAPARAREIQSMAGQGFGNYLSRPGVVTARGSGNYNHSTENVATVPSTTADIAARRSRIDQLLADKLGTGDRSVVNNANYVSDEEQAELDAFFKGAGVSDSVAMPPMMVAPSITDPGGTDQLDVDDSNSYSRIPPLMVVETREPVATRAPVIVKAPVVTKAAVKVPTKIPAAAVVDDDDGFGGFGDDEEEPAKPAPKKVAPKKPAPKKPTPVPATTDDDEDGFGGFGGFGDDEEEPAKPAPKKSAPKKPAPKKADDADDEDDFEGFMDFDEGFVPRHKNSDVASRTNQKRMPSFSERVAAEFQRQGISTRVAAPPIRKTVIAEGPVKESFARSLKSEIASGLPSDREFLSDDQSSLITSLLDFNDNAEAGEEDKNNTPARKHRTYSGSGRIQELLKKLNSAI